MSYTARHVPKIIYSLWLQGVSAAPALVRLNFARWGKLNPGYVLKLLEQKDVELVLDGCGLAVDGLPPAAISDIVRARLLAETGGIWADASVFPVRPLDEVLPQMLNQSGFFAFARPGPDRLVSSWFLVSSPDNPLARGWWREVRRFWAQPRQLSEGVPADPVLSVSPEGPAGAYPYFWFHYLFQYLVENDKAAAAIWEASIKAPAGPPHWLQALLANGNRPAAEAIAQAVAVGPVQKLDWRVDYPLDVLAGI
jgi:hypothetical protein